MKKMLKNISVLITGLIGLIYLINPGAGVIELIPDNLPIVGNLDEMAATILLVGALRHFGVDILKAFTKKKDTEKSDEKNLPRS